MSHFRGRCLPRTPIGKVKGVLAGVRPDHLAADVITALVGRNPGLDVAGHRRRLLGRGQPGGRGQPERGPDGGAAGRAAGEIAGETVNRLCGSGMEAVGDAARAIAAGEADICLAGGSESMTRAPFVLARSADGSRATWTWPTPGWAGGW